MKTNKLERETGGGGGGGGVWLLHFSLSYYVCENVIMAIIINVLIWRLINWREWKCDYGYYY